MKKLKKRVLLVLGGNSKEREVSLESGKACYNALKKLGKLGSINFTEGFS